MSKQGKRITNETCPRCKGTGIARSFKRGNKYPKSIVNKATKLFESGLSLRAIAKKLDIKHPYTVQKLLTRN